MRGLRAIAAITAVTALWSVAPAHAQNILNDFRRTGRINPCNYSDGQLRRGLQGLPPDIQQYAPGLADQLAAGREGCGGGGQPAAVPVPTLPGAPPPSGGPPKPQIKVPAPPAPKPKPRPRIAEIATPTVTTTVAAGSDTPGWLAPVLTCLALGGVFLALVRFGGFSSERFTRPLRASAGELAGRSADALAQLRDSVRFGR